MTFNIRYDNPKDNDNCWEHRKSSVLKIFDFYSPEVIGIQEGLINQIKYIENNLIDYNYIGVGRDDGEKKGEYSAIFYNKKKLKLISSKTYWLSETPEKVSIGWDASMERIVTFGEFLNLRTQESLFIFNCHFDHRGEISRENSSELILKLIENKDIENNKVIVMGDLNCLPDSKPIKTLKSKLEDSRDISVKEPYGPTGTSNGFDLDRLIKNRIDYIFTKNIKVIDHRIIDDRRDNNLFISDHLPVMVRIIY
tara:strand:- start:44 stop:802 length:759 start_codon:yes stop_codon:yes gene_type:complete